MNVADTRLLALGTSTSTCSVALLTRVGGVSHVDRVDAEPGAGKSGQILQQVDQLLTARRIILRQLDAIAFDAGPGAFTGLRIGCGVAQGLGFALNKPLLPIGAIDAMDVGWEGWPLRLLAIDARMGELYCAWVRGAVASSIATASEATHGSWSPAKVHVKSPEAAIELFESAIGASLVSDSTVVAIGNGFSASPAMAAWASARGARIQSEVWADGARLAHVAERAWRLDRAVAARDAAPLYVRDKVALDADEQARQRQTRRQAVPGSPAGAGPGSRQMGSSG